MEKHTKQAIIISIIILLVLCAGAAVFAFRTDIQCLWWYVQCRTLEKDNLDYKREVVKKLEEAKAVRVLCWLLEDDDWRVRNNAIMALGNLSDKRAVESLIAALKDTDWPVRPCAAYALGKLGDKRAVEPLIVALKDPKNTMLIPSGGGIPLSVQGVVASVLGELGDRRAVEPLIAVLKNGNEVGQLFAVYALGDLGDKRALKPLKQALAVEKNFDVRKAIQSTIEKLESVKQ